MIAYSSGCMHDQFMMTRKLCRAVESTRLDATGPSGLGHRHRHRHARGGRCPVPPHCRAAACATLTRAGAVQSRSVSLVLELGGRVATSPVAGKPPPTAPTTPSSAELLRSASLLLAGTRSRRGERQACWLLGLSIPRSRSVSLCCLHWCSDQPCHCSLWSVGRNEGCVHFRIVRQPSHLTGDTSCGPRQSITEESLADVVV